MTSRVVKWSSSGQQVVLTHGDPESSLFEHKIDPINTFCQIFVYYVEHRLLILEFFPVQFALFVLIIIRHTHFRHKSPLKCNFYYVNFVFIEQKHEKIVDRVNFVPLFEQTETSCAQTLYV